MANWLIQTLLVILVIVVTLLWCYVVLKAGTTPRRRKMAAEPQDDTNMLPLPPLKSARTMTKALFDFNDENPDTPCPFCRARMEPRLTQVSGNRFVWVMACPTPCDDSRFMHFAAL